MPISNDFVSYNRIYNFKSNDTFSCVLIFCDIAVLKSLSGNKDIIICKPDKGRGIVIIDKIVCVEKMKYFFTTISRYQFIYAPIDKFT